MFQGYINIDEIASREQDEDGDTAVVALILMV